MDLYYERAGHGPEILLVHGWGLHSGVWHEFAKRLVRTCRVTRVDLPGHGRSPTATAYTLDELVEALCRACPAPAVWVGWSLGAMVALAAACVRPQCIRALGLFGATPRFVQAADWTCAMEPAALQRFADDLEHDYAGTLTRFLSLQFGRAAKERAALRRLRATILQRTAPALTALRAGLAVLEHTDLRTAVAAIDVPTLVLHGERDRLVPLAAGTYLASAMPRAHLHRIADAGHAPFLTHSAVCLRRLERLVHA